MVVKRFPGFAFDFSEAGQKRENILIRRDFPPLKKLRVTFLFPAIDF